MVPLFGSQFQPWFCNDVCIQKTLTVWTFFKRRPTPKAKTANISNNAKIFCLLWMWPPRTPNNPKTMMAPRQGTITRCIFGCRMSRVSICMVQSEALQSQTWAWGRRMGSIRKCWQVVTYSIGESHISIGLVGWIQIDVFTLATFVANALQERRGRTAQALESIRRHLCVALLWCWIRSGLSFSEFYWFYEKKNLDINRNKNYILRQTQNVTKISCVSSRMILIITIVHGTRNMMQTTSYTNQTGY